MKKLKVIVLAAILSAWFITTGAVAKDTGQKTKKPGAIAVESVTWTATVKSLDYVKKTVVLEDENGRKVPINAKNARNLDQVLVGDKVKVNYIQELAISVRKAETPAVAGAARTVKLTPKGKMPGGVVTETVQVQADVEEVNNEKRTITLKGPSGESRTYNVSKQVKHLKEIKKGDQVVIDVTQALALEVIKQ